MSHATAIVALEDVKDLHLIHQAVSHQMEPFDENGRWFREGSRWDYWTLGDWGHFAGKDVVDVSLIEEKEYARYETKRLAETYLNANEKIKDSSVKKIVYGINEEESLDEFISRNMPSSEGGWFPSSYAFIRKRRWHEPMRMGWFGVSIKTECELKGNENPRRCHTKVGDDARITTWMEDYDLWRKNFYVRFIKALKPSVKLVAVDYHV